MIRFDRGRLAALLLLTAGLLLVGCSSVTRDKYSKVKAREVDKDGKVTQEGMTRAEVEGILGKGTEMDAKDLDMTPFLESRVGPAPPGESTDLGTRKGLPPLADLKTKTTWLQWSSGKKFILVGFMDDKAVVKTAKIPE